MVNNDLKKSVLEDILALKNQGFQIVLVHGGGPYINRILDAMNIKSEFIGGHRKTTSEALKYTEMTLLGEVNSDLVARANSLGLKSVGLSGKDASMVKATKRLHIEDDEEYDLGWVGDVASVDTDLIEILLNSGITPIISCIASDDQGNSYNINADVMAGALAGALKANLYCSLTNIDGLRCDVEDPHSLIRSASIDELKSMMGTVIVGGMIPKIDSCIYAIEQGSEKSVIVNGTTPNILKNLLLKEEDLGTLIHK